MLGGNQGIGKDTVLEPVKQAVGPWNFFEVSPQHMLGRFNGFLKSVILRVNEARDLGDVNRFQFYDHMKAYTAAPPDVLRVDEKNLREHSVFNCVGVIITTNHKADGIFLPADDRRHFVAWSALSKDRLRRELLEQALALVLRGRHARRGRLPCRAGHLRLRPESAATEDAGLLGHRRRQPRARGRRAGRHPRQAGHAGRHDADRASPTKPPATSRRGSRIARTAAPSRTGLRSAAMSRCATILPTTACGSSTAGAR